MSRQCFLIAFIPVLTILNMSSAQESKLYTLQAEHELLKRFAGEWQFERSSVPEDGAMPEIVGKGIISAELLGGFFVISRWSGDVYGMDYTAFQLLGYDIEQRKFTGSWVDSFMSYRWELKGTVDEESQEFIVMASGPAPAGGTAMFRERYQFNSADTITIIGEMQQGENWVAISTTLLTRKR